MVDDDDGEPDEDELLPELCDLCGVTISNGSEVHALVPDSSVIHARDPDLDGQRFLTACSPRHLEELQEQYRRRPFVNEEQWAGRISRALGHHPEGLGQEQLAAETGLSPLQIQRALAWQRERFRRWREEYGDGPSGPPAGDR
ncbi:hypothetical protein [Streptomyces sp. 7N604]|uniref:hypothetical protein n=1 Tax=Streptomyces sp. 7N604 TaxID=3457415 RepID=UPI003FD1CB65